MITWNTVDNENFKIEPTGVIRFNVGGVCVIHVIVRHCNRTNGETFCLMNERQVVGSCSDASGSNPTNVNGIIAIITDTVSNTATFRLLSW